MKFITWLKKSYVFSFLSSVRLAVPLLLVIAATIAYGTIVESQYNSDYAKLLVYQASWFEGLMLLLWLNIFCATISRIPFKKHHLGFVITHIGLLTLLIGAIITSRYGIDGQLSVREGTSDNEVILSDLVFEVKNQKDGETKKFKVKKSASFESQSYFSSINPHIPFKISNYKPFVEIKEGIKTIPDNEAGLGIEFEVKNRFTTQSAWLHVQDQPTFQMGPASFILLNSSAPKKAAKLLIYDAESGALITENTISKSKPNVVNIKNIKVSVQQILEQGVVSKNKISEGGKRGLNPALELLIEKNGKSLREVVFALFPGFSIQSQGAFGLKFKYEAASQNTESDSGNTIAFQVDTQDTSHTVITLSKGNQEVLKQKVSIGEPLQTPWMGMEITVLKILEHSAKAEHIQDAVLKPKMPLPPSAIFIQTGDDDGLWLPENSTQIITSGDTSYELFYGSDIYRLPYSMKLNKFLKTVYPGSATPMTFSSEVSIENENHVISMNEPLKRMGFTLYQSSYVENPGEPPISVFSVNQDPGRPVKYAGSLILALGIIIFTVMRSSWYRARSNK